MRFKNGARVIGRSAPGLLVMLLAAGAQAATQGPRYTFAEVGYVNVEIDDDGFFGEDPDGDGFQLSGSVAVADMVHLFAGYTDAELGLDNFGVDVDYKTYSLGVGLNYAVTPSVDLVGRLAYLKVDIGVDGFGSEDENGYGISVGSRAMLTENFELNGFLTYSDFGDDLDDTAVSIGAVYNFTPMFAVTGGIDFGDDSRAFNLGLRLYFGDR